MAKSLTVATFDNVGEAEILRQDLESIGVHAWLSNETITVALWYVGSALGGVKVQIDAADEQIAYKLVAERQRRRDRNIEATEWYCGRCREWISPSFDICWSCRGPRDEVEKVPPAHLVKDRLQHEEHADEQMALGREGSKSLIDRAWRASVVGWALCPPVVLPPLAHLYSAWLITRLDAAKLDSSGRRRLRGALLSNGTAFAVFLLLWAYAIFVLFAEQNELIP